jgi:hypothetical protein
LLIDQSLETAIKISGPDKGRRNESEAANPPPSIRAGRRTARPGTADAALPHRPARLLIA